MGATPLVVKKRLVHKIPRQNVTCTERIRNNICTNCKKMLPAKRKVIETIFQITVYLSLTIRATCFLYWDTRRLKTNLFRNDEKQKTTCLCSEMTRSKNRQTFFLFRNDEKQKQTNFFSDRNEEK